MASLMWYLCDKWLTAPSALKNQSHVFDAQRGWSPDGQTIYSLLHCIVLVTWWSNCDSNNYSLLYCIVLVKWWSNHGSSDYSEVYCIVLVKWWSNYGLGKHGRWWNVNMNTCGRTSPLLGTGAWYAKSFDVDIYISIPRWPRNIVQQCATPGCLTC